MAKELFEDIKTGKKEFLFCWESSSDNEKLKDFLQNSSIIDIEADKKIENICNKYGATIEIIDNTEKIEE